jgi:hypothetical protein
MLRGDLTSGLKGKRANRLLRATGSLFLTSIMLRRPRLQEYNPTGGFSLQSHGQNLIVRSLSPRDE